MKEGCLDLVDFASKRALVNLLSNGRLVTDDVLRFCAERGIRLSVSMPGLKSFAENTDSDTPVERPRAWLRDDRGRCGHETQLAGALRNDFRRVRRGRGLAALEPLSARRTRAFSSRTDADGRGSARSRRCCGGSAFAREALRTFRNGDARMPHRRGQIRTPRDFDRLFCGNGVLHGRAECATTVPSRFSVGTSGSGFPRARSGCISFATTICQRCALVAHVRRSAWAVAAKRRVFSLVRRPPPTRFSPTDQSRVITDR